MLMAKYLALVVADVLAWAVNFFFAPLLVFAANDEGYLPSWLSWFQTPGDSLDKDYNKKRFPGPQTGFKRWYSRVAWLYRNATYGFDIDVLGAKVQPADTLEIIGDDATGNRPIHSGVCRYRLYRNGKLIYWQYYYVKQWSDTYCVRLNFGWKIWQFKPGSSESCQLVCSPNPFMGLSN